MCNLGPTNTYLAINDEKHIFLNIDFIVIHLTSFKLDLNSKEGGNW